MIPAEDARAVLYALPVAAVARAAWGAASGDRDAAVVLDAHTGAVRVLSWPTSSDPDVGPGDVVLAYAPAARHAGITRARGLEIPPSEELVEEHVARLAAETFEADGLGLARAVEERLAAALQAGRAT